MIRICLDCTLPFLAYTSRKQRCPACQESRIAKQKLESQHKRGEKRRQYEHFDISPEEIEARYAAALKEIRARPAEQLEQRRSFQWLYSEPGR